MSIRIQKSKCEKPDGTQITIQVNKKDANKY